MDEICAKCAFAGTNVFGGRIVRLMLQPEGPSVLPPTPIPILNLVIVSSSATTNGAWRSRNRVRRD